MNLVRQFLPKTFLHRNRVEKARDWREDVQPFKQARYPNSRVPTRESWCMHVAATCHRIAMEMQNWGMEAEAFSSGDVLTHGSLLSSRFVHNVKVRSK